MFREMRRSEKQLTKSEAEAILSRCTNGTLAVHGDDGYPYAVPVSYAYADGKIYFHGALAGHKADAIERNDKVSFCVTAEDDIKPESFNTWYNSVVAFGRARLLRDDAEKQHCLECLIGKYSAAYHDQGQEYIKKAWAKTAAFEIRVEHMTGKSGVPKS
jgi:nitroimidazol reductase NimA-like FMN-containing flavoprotein (pyridoxamine 5'-phosphate oxidase superfamily)